MAPRSKLPEDWVVRLVPVEIWRRIFEFIASSSEPFDPAGILHIIRCFHVCSTWRSITDNFPELWTNVALEFDRTGDEHCFPNEKLLALILRKSRTLPLTMGLVATAYPKFRTANGMKALELFLRTIHRARLLKLDSRVLDTIWEDTDPNLLAEFELQVQPAPLLERLVLGKKEPEDDNFVDRAVSLLWKPAPLLRTLSFSDSFVGYATDQSLTSTDFPFHQITSLEFNCPLSLAAIGRFLPLMPSLVTAVFNRIYEDTNQTCKPIEFPLLQTLSLYDQYRNAEFEYEILPVMATLKFIASPVLASLRLSFDDDWDQDAWLTFVEAPSLEIQHLHFDITCLLGSDLRESYLAMCISMLPCLHTLDLSFRKVGSARNRTGRDLMSKGFPDSMRELDEGGQFKLCPLLEKLTIDYDSLSDTTTAVFADMIGARLRRSGQGGFALVVKEADKLGDAPKSHSEMIRLLLLRRAGLKLTIEPSIWLEDLFDY